MLYVQQSLGPGEEILMGARFHWMYTLQAVFWIIFGLAIGIALGYASIWYDVTQEIRTLYPNIPEALYQKAWDSIVIRRGGYLKMMWELHPGIRFTILGSFIVGLWFFVHMMIVKATTEIAITSERLIYKKGLIARQIGELNIDRIEGVSVRQDVVARLCGYGRVCIRGMGVGEVLLPPIEAPIAFRRAIQEALSIQSKGGNLKSTDDF